MPIRYAANDSPWSLDQSKVAKANARQCTIRAEIIECYRGFSFQSWPKKISEQHSALWGLPRHNSSSNSAISERDREDRTFIIGQLHLFIGPKF
ncbi:hypothetical protein CQ14_04420 [Bradyrhizobium lablabi]|uniref:Uncharacterized protein n=1 Tax=Bradyrhizobium lablabi TaxID=722472 RepID=A0A0R3M6E7_9BRAD|nr:hypothetical protein CQ14_04420 [Bradyrhizobium lablabi]